MEDRELLMQNLFLFGAQAAQDTADGSNGLLGWGAPPPIQEQSASATAADLQWQAVEQDAEVAEDQAKNWLAAEHESCPWPVPPANSSERAEGECDVCPPAHSQNEWQQQPANPADFQAGLHDKILDRAPDQMIEFDVQTPSPPMNAMQSVVDFRPHGGTIVERDARRHDDAPRTDFLNPPVSGILRTSRGTIEAVLHPNGRRIDPIYNRCGILNAVELSDGVRFERNPSNSTWLMLDRKGWNMAEEQIVALALDRRGNLWYRTESGRKTTFHVNGSVSID